MTLVADETPQEAFDRGQIAGHIAEQLRRHEDHLAKINGSTEKTALALEALNDTQQQMALQLQRLADQSAADAKTRVATAAALKEAEDARRVTAEGRWTPLARTLLVLGALVSLATLAIGLYAATRP